MYMRHTQIHLKQSFLIQGSHKTYVYEKNIIWKSSAYPDHIDRM